MAIDSDVLRAWWGCFLLQVQLAKGYSKSAETATVGRHVLAIYWEFFQGADGSVGWFPDIPSLP